MNSEASAKVTVIRVIKYEGTEEAVRRAIAQSLPLGTKLCSGYDITVAEHRNELPPQLTLEEQRVADLFKGIAPPTEMETQSEDGPFMQAYREAKAQGCSCPPPGYSGLWGAGPCPVHHGFRRPQPRK